MITWGSEIKGLSSSFCFRHTNQLSQISHETLKFKPSELDRSCWAELKWAYLSSYQYWTYVNICMTHVNMCMTYYVLHMLTYVWHIMSYICNLSCKHMFPDICQHAWFYICSKYVEHTSNIFSFLLVIEETTLVIDQRGEKKRFSYHQLCSPMSQDLDVCFTFWFQILKEQNLLIYSITKNIKISHDKQRSIFVQLLLRLCILFQYKYDRLLMITKSLCKLNQLVRNLWYFVLNNKCSWKIIVICYFSHEAWKECGYEAMAVWKKITWLYMTLSVGKKHMSDMCFLFRLSCPTYVWSMYIYYVKLVGVIHMYTSCNTWCLHIFLHVNICLQVCQTKTYVGHISNICKIRHVDICQETYVYMTNYICMTYVQYR